MSWISRQNFLSQINELHGYIAIKLTLKFNSTLACPMNQVILASLSKVRHHPYVLEHGYGDFKELLENMDKLIRSWPASGVNCDNEREKLKQMEQEMKKTPFVIRVEETVRHAEQVRERRQDRRHWWSLKEAERRD